MGDPALKKEYTLKEYFELDEASEEKYEFDKGEVLAMSGGTINHARIGGNIYRRLSDKLEAAANPCDTFNSDTRLFMSSLDAIVYPDAMVVCGEVESTEEGEAVTNPILIVEVISKSTEGYDRGEKFFKYQSLPSFEEYVLVDQYQQRVEVLRKRKEGGWLLNAFFPDQGTVPFASIGVELSFSEIYEKVKWK